MNRTLYRTGQLILIALIFILGYFVSQTVFISNVELNFFSHLIALAPPKQQALEVIFAADWLIRSIYTALFLLYTAIFLWSRQNRVHLISAILVSFMVVMAELLSAVFSSYFLPMLVPSTLFVVLTLYTVFIRKSRHLLTYRRLTKSLCSAQRLGELIENNEIKSALWLLKTCPCTDELLEQGYELGMLLEAEGELDAALDLYHYLLQYDAGLEEIVNRLESQLAQTLSSENLPLNQQDRRSEKKEKNKMIGYFQIKKSVACGATARVYEARDLRTHNRIALKVMLKKPEDKQDKERIDKWLKEAELVSRMHHRNIVKIHDAGRHHQLAYIAMDYISGYPMSMKLRRLQFISFGECVRLSKAVLKALQAAHNLGIIHGDIKPANIMYDDNRKDYIVTDFGSAYLFKRGKVEAESIVGTPTYMSPEQLMGKNIDGRSDLFSFAVTLVHLFSGNKPFSAEDLVQLKQQILNDKPNLGNTKLPPEMLEIMLKALEKKPAKRYADAQQMLTAIENCELRMKQRAGA